MGFPKKRESSSEPSPPEQQQPQDQSQQQQSRQMWSPYDEGRRNRGPLWAVLGGLGVLGLLAGGLVVMFNAETSAPATTAARQTSDPLPSAPPGEFAYLEQRETDPEPLTVKEVFAGKKITIDGRKYTMTTSRKDTKCAEAVEGTKLEKALKSGKCTMIIRGSFKSSDDKIIGTIGVANLLDTAASKKAEAAGGKGERQDYLKALPGKDEITKFLGAGEAGAEVWPYGHYAVMIWFQFKDGHKPSSKESKQLAQAANDVAKATVFKALDARRLTGYPA